MHPRLIVQTYREHGLRGLATLVRYWSVRLRTLLTGPERECLRCGWRGRAFRPMVLFEDASVRGSAICPACGAWERHRAVAAFYKSFFAREFPSQPRPRVVHLAAESMLEPLLRAEAGEYVKTNFEKLERDEIFLDLHDVTLPPGSVDVFVMNYVLCCTPPPLPRIVANLFRTLRPGGIVIACEAFTEGDTHELPRPAHGGHWRTFGRSDVADRFGPFAVEMVDLTEHFTDRQRKRYGVFPRETVLLARKPADVAPSRPTDAAAHLRMT